MWRVRFKAHSDIRTGRTSAAIDLYVPEWVAHTGDEAICWASGYLSGKGDHFDAKSGEVVSAPRRDE